MCVCVCVCVSRWLYLIVACRVFVVVFVGVSLCVGVCVVVVAVATVVVVSWFKPRLVQGSKSVTDSTYCVCYLHWKLLTVQSQPFRFSSLSELALGHSSVAHATQLDIGFYVDDDFVYASSGRTDSALAQAYPQCEICDMANESLRK